jgi:hypothetical protein
MNGVPQADVVSRLLKLERIENSDKGNISSRTGKLNSGAERSAVRAVRNKCLRRTSYTFR